MDDSGFCKSSRSFIGVVHAEHEGYSLVGHTCEGIEVLKINILLAELIKNAQHAAILRDPTMAAATLTGATADAMRAAAANENGAMAGFMGMGMAMNAAGGMGAQNLYAMGAQQNAQAAQNGAAAGGWVCTCGTQNTGNFCQNCGKPKNTSWTCECGTQNTGNFCQNCGKPKP